MGRVVSATNHNPGNFLQFRDTEVPQRSFSCNVILPRGKAGFASRR